MDKNKSLTNYEKKNVKAFCGYDFLHGLPTPPFINFTYIVLAPILNFFSRWFCF